MANGRSLGGDLARCARVFGGGPLLAAAQPHMNRACDLDGHGYVYIHDTHEYYERI